MDFIHFNPIFVQNATIYYVVKMLKHVLRIYSCIWSAVDPHLLELNSVSQTHAIGILLLMDQAFGYYLEGLFSPVETTLTFCNAKGQKSSLHTLPSI